MIHVELGHAAGVSGRLGYLLVDVHTALAGRRSFGRQAVAGLIEAASGMWMSANSVQSYMVNQATDSGGRIWV
jgi:predicted trehalose synthase